jgi:hypothetical protein
LRKLWTAKRGGIVAEQWEKEETEVLRKLASRHCRIELVHQH